MAVERQKAGKNTNLENYGKKLGIDSTILDKYLKKGIQEDLLLSLIQDISSNVLKGSRINPKEMSINGQSKSLRDWSNETGLSYKLLYSRWRSGVLPEFFLLSKEEYQKQKSEIQRKTPSKNNPRITINKETKTLKQWAFETGISIKLLKNRLENGIKGKKLIEPVKKNEEKIIIDGIEKTIKEWAKQYQIPEKTLMARRKKGWTGVKLLLPYHKTKKINKVDIGGKEKTLGEIAEEAGISKGAVYGRLKRGYTGEALLMPKDNTYMTLDGDTLLLKQWRLELMMSYKEIIDLYQRYKNKSLTKDDLEWVKKNRRGLISQYNYSRKDYLALLNNEEGQRIS